MASKTPTTVADLRARERALLDELARRDPEGASKAQAAALLGRDIDPDDIDAPDSGELDDAEGIEGDETGSASSRQAAALLDVVGELLASGDDGGERDPKRDRVEEEAAKTRGPVDGDPRATSKAQAAAIGRQP